MANMGDPFGRHGGVQRTLGMRLTAVDLATLAGAAMLVAFIAAIAGVNVGL